MPHPPTSFVFMRSWELNPNGRVGALRGRPLRYVLVHLLHDAFGATGGGLTVAELVEGCEEVGVAFDGRASKLVSDALRWEVRRGRVVRVSRGRYVFGAAPRSTLWRIKKRVGQYKRHLAELSSWVERPVVVPSPPIPENHPALGGLLGLRV